MIELCINNRVVAGPAPITRYETDHVISVVSPEVGVFRSEC